MYVVPRRTLKLTILSCESLPPLTSTRLWADERLIAEHSSLTRKFEQAGTQLQQSATVTTDDNASTVLKFPLGLSAPNSQPVANYMDYCEAASKLQAFLAMYGDSAASDKKIAPNCYACVTLERNTVAPPMAVTEVKRANHDPFWNCTTEDINIDLMLLCGEMESASYLYCQRLRIAVYHHFGFGQDAGCTAWTPDKPSDGLLIGEAFLAVGELFADPCQTRHELKVYGTDHCLISACKLHIDTKVSCSSAKVLKMFPCQTAFPTMLPVELENEREKKCSADVSVSGFDSISLPSAVKLAVASSKGCSRKHKCKSKSKCKCKC